MATNSNETTGSKTTKLVRGIHSWIKFQKHQGIESLTIQGNQALADLSQDKNGDTSLILNSDKDKVNTVASSVPYLAISHTITGTDPYQDKTATISQDLTQFPLHDGELVTVTKDLESLTIHDEKVKEFVATTVTAKETEIKQFIGEVKEELTTKINEHSGGTSAEPFDKEAFKQEVFDFLEWNWYSTFEHGHFKLISDNDNFGFTNVTSDAQIELAFYHNKELVESVLLTPEDFTNNKQFSNDMMVYKLSVSPYASDIIGGSDVEDPTGKGQLRVHVTLKQAFDSTLPYEIIIRYYKDSLSPSLFSVYRIAGDGTRLNTTPETVGNVPQPLE